MKILNKIATVFLVLFGMVKGFAQPGCPTCPSGPPNPPAPIDGIGLSILMLAAILLGMYIIYKHKLKTKASV